MKETKRVFWPTAAKATIDDHYIEIMYGNRRVRVPTNQVKTVTMAHGNILGQELELDGVDGTLGTIRLRTRAARIFQDWLIERLDARRIGEGW